MSERKSTAMGSLWNREWSRSMRRPGKDTGGAPAGGVASRGRRAQSVGWHCKMDLLRRSDAVEIAEAAWWECAEDVASVERAQVDVVLVKRLSRARWRRALWGGRGRAQAKY